MDPSTIYSKTAKGMTELKNGCKNLAREPARVLSIINGKSSVADFLANGASQADKLTPALETLLNLGLIRIFTGAIAPIPTTAERFHEPKDDWEEFSDSLPALEVTELSPQESVQAWAEARRGASELKKTGFYSYGSKSLLNLSAAHNSLTALVVEDDEELAELLDVLLTEKGFKVQTIGDMSAALAAMHSDTAPNLVLLDIVLPGLEGKDGFDLLTFMRRKESWAKVPVVMVTSQVSDDQVMQGLKAGADGYIFKPFKWETLYACIKSVVGI
jgi:CheY-like chemotaxis protein